MYEIRVIQTFQSSNRICEFCLDELVTQKIATVCEGETVEHYVICGTNECMNEARALVGLKPVHDGPATDD